MTSLRDIEIRLRRLEPTQASSELRQKLFARIARVAPTRIHWLDRLWFSRPMRFAAVSTLILAIALSISESRRLELQVVAITGPVHQTPRHLNLDPTLEMELGITKDDRQSMHLASRYSLQQHLASQNELATLLEL